MGATCCHALEEKEERKRTVVRGTYTKEVGETLAGSSLTQSDLVCKSHIKQGINSHLGFKHSFNIAVLSNAVNWSDAVNWFRYYLPTFVEVESTQRSHNLPIE